MDCCVCCCVCWSGAAPQQVLRFSEEQLSGGVLDDSCLSVIARGCTQLQELELVQVSWSRETQRGAHRAGKVLPRWFQPKLAARSCSAHVKLVVEAMWE